MVDTAKLRGIFAEHNDSVAKAAKVIGVTRDTMYRKMRRGVFGTDEVEILIDHYDIEDPAAIFFKRK